MNTLEILRSYVQLHNDGVRTGSFGPMLALFDDRADLRFINIPFGPFTGIQAIAEAFRSNPPDDELLLFDIVEKGPYVCAVYGWKSRPGHQAGTIEMTTDSNRIVQLIIHIGLANTIA